MNPLELSQYVYIAALVVGTVAAFCGAARFIAFVMWINLLFTIQYSHAPEILQRLDLLSAIAIVMVLRDRAALTVAFLFCMMVFVYPLVEVFDFNLPYIMVDGLAYAQLLAMGAAGSGGGISILRRGIISRLSSLVHSQEARLDATPDDCVAVGKALGQRVNG